MAELWEQLDPPPVIAARQRDYDRRAMVFRMREAEWTLQAIATRLGVTRERVRQMEAKFIRQRHLPTPIEAWLKEWKDPLRYVKRVGPLTTKEIIHRARDVADRAAREKAKQEADEQSWREYEEHKEREWRAAIARSNKVRDRQMELEAQWRAEGGDTRDLPGTRRRKPPMLEVQDCQWCGRRHAMTCPRIREIEWDTSMQPPRLKRIVFWDFGPGSNPNFEAQLNYWGVQEDGRSQGEGGAGADVATGDGVLARNGR